MLKSEDNVISGASLSEWLTHKIGITSNEKIAKIYNAMIEKGLLFPVQTAKTKSKVKQSRKELDAFHPGEDSYYKFFQDKEQIPSNLTKSANEICKPPIELALEMISKTNELLHEIWPDHFKPAPKKLSTATIKESNNYRQLKALLNDLQNIKFGKLTMDESIATFLNIY